MSDRSEILGLPLLQSGQAQKEVTHNVALARLERWTFPHVHSRTVDSPPSAPGIGAAWLVPEGAAGAWAGHSGDIAEWNGSEWTFLPAPEGMMLSVRDEEVVIAMMNGSWAVGFPAEGVRVNGRLMLAAAPQTINDPNGGEVVDAEARSALAALLGHMRSLGLLAA